MSFPYTTTPEIEIVVPKRDSTNRFDGPIT